MNAARSVDRLLRLLGVLAATAGVSWATVGWATAARGESITFAFEGTVREVFDGVGALRDTVQPHQRFYGSFTFDSQTPNTGPGTDEGQRGLYHHAQPPSGVWVPVGRYHEA